MGRTSQVREKLIEAASRLMWQRGFVDVGVSELCAAADAKPGSFYYFFKSKSALAVAALEAHWLRHETLVLIPAGSPKNPLERIERYIELLAEHTVLDSNVMGSPFGNMSGSLGALDDVVKETLRDIYGRHYAFFADLLREAHNNRQIRVSDIDRKAKSMVALIEGSQGLAHLHNDPQLLKSLLNDLYKVVGPIKSLNMTPEHLRIEV